MAAVVAIALVPATLGARDYPPGSEPKSTVAGGHAEDADTLSVGQIARQPVFWGLALAAGANITAIMTTTFNMMPLAQSLGYDRGHGALLSTVQSVGAMLGSVLFGWVADHIGGARGLALVSGCMGALLLALQIPHLPYPAMLGIMALFGMVGGGNIPNISRALAHSLGRGSFSRAFGLQSAISVPMTAISIWGMGAAFTYTGSYRLALLSVAVLLLAMVLPALSAATHRAAGPDPD